MSERRHADRTPSPKPHLQLPPQAAQLISWPARPCLAPASCAVPLRLTQVGAADARDGLTPHTWT